MGLTAPDPSNGKMTLHDELRALILGHQHQPRSHHAFLNLFVFHKLFPNES
jgi:hypothetical protein